MSFIPYHVDPGFPHVENTPCVESHPPLQSTQLIPAFDDLPCDPILFQNPLQATLSPGPWAAPVHSSWDYQLNMVPTWDAFSQSFTSPSSSTPSCDPFGQMPLLPYGADPDYEAYSPPSTAASDLERSPAIDSTPSAIRSSLLSTPVVPSSDREVPLVHARLRTRKSNKESSKAAADDRKYTCDFCPVQMARLHDINRHMRIHTGVHPYACAGCGETFRRTDARTRHWCKQPECFRIHSVKAPASKARRRIPTS